MYLGMIESYDRRPVSHVFIVILRLDDMGVGSSRALTLGAARDDVVEQTHVECDVNQTLGSGSVQGHRSASIQVQYSGRHRIKLYSRHGGTRMKFPNRPAEGGWFLMHHVNVAWIVRPQAKKQSIQPPSMTLERFIVRGMS